MKKPAVIKIFKRLLITLTAIVVFVFAAGIGLSYYYKDKVVGIVVSRLNNYLKTEVQVKNIDFTVFKHFPNASVVFYGVTIKGSPVLKKNVKWYSDTLLAAESVSLDFDIIKLIKKKYVFKSIHINNGKLNLIIDKKGTNNFDIIKSSAQDEGNDNFEIQLSKIHLKRVKLYYGNSAKQEYLSGDIPQINIKGKIKENHNSFSFNGNIHINNYSISGINYLNNKTLKTNLIINQTQGGWELRIGKMEFEKINFLAEGKIAIEDKTNINLHLKSEDENINTLISLIPKKYRQYLNDYFLNGKMSLTANIVGESDYKTYPHIEAKFNISDASVNYVKKNIKLTGLKLDALFSNGKNNNVQSSFIEVKNFSANIDSSYISASYGIKNFLNPYLYGKSFVKLDLKKVIEFLGIDTIQDITGTIKGTLNFSGYAKSLENKKINNFQAEGTLKLNGVNILFRQDDNPFLKNLNSQVKFNNRELEINSLSAVYKNQKVNIKGKILNFMNYILSNSQKLNGIFILKSPKIYLDKFIAGKTSSSSNSSPIERIKFDLNIDTLVYNNTNFLDTKAKGIYEDNKILIPQFSTRLGNGIISGKTNYRTNTVYGSINTKDLDIRLFMKTFKNFGQDFISYKNLKGNLTSQTDFFFTVNDSGKIVTNSINAESDITITNGELINFEPLESLSKFLTIKEIKHIYFTDIKNKIYIENSKITIPSMHINSSSLDFDIEGFHTFNGYYKYHLQLLLSQILSKKYRQQKSVNENEYAIEYNTNTNQTKIFLLLENVNGKLKIKYDKAKVKKHIKEKIKQEKESLKSIIKEEFNWFTKDTTVKNKVKQKKDLKNKLKAKKEKKDKEKQSFQFDFGE